MKQQKISGNICPHIKKAIQECLKVKKHAINKIWIDELTTTINGENRLKDVKDNIDSYGKVVKELISAYKLYDESVDTIVDVWKEMLNSSSELKKTFYLLIMTEFVESIWSDSNMKIVIEEIVTFKDYLKPYVKEVDELLEINKKLEEVTQNYGNKSDTKSDNDTQST